MTNLIMQNYVVLLKTLLEFVEHYYEQYCVSKCLVEAFATYNIMLTT